MEDSVEVFQKESQESYRKLLFSGNLNILDPDHFPLILKSAMYFFDLEQAQVAEAVEVSESSVSRWISRDITPRYQKRLKTIRWIQDLITNRSTLLQGTKLCLMIKDTTAACGEKGISGTLRVFEATPSEGRCKECQSHYRLLPEKRREFLRNQFLQKVLQQP